jgi:glycerophosphoryl diester phosphodiesterase
VPLPGPGSPDATVDTTQRFRQIEIVGHRGARDIAPENTLAGFEKALATGVDMIELDVHLSKDGELVVIHDANLDRTTNGQGTVREHTLAELKELDATAQYTGPGLFGAQEIPTLQEVYDLVPDDVQINVEIKTSGDGSRYPGIEERVLEVVRSNEALAQTVVSSFDFPTIQEIQRLEPELATYAIISQGYFYEQGLLGRRPKNVAADLVAHGFAQVAVNKEYLSKDLLSELQQAGLVVGVWIIDDVKEMMHFAELGVDRITTDRPDLLVPAAREQA